MITDANPLPSTSAAVDKPNVAVKRDYMPHRMLQLDIVRGIAILLVLGSHQIIGMQHAGKARVLAGFLGRIGWSGVDLFFVLSGFLVGGLILREIVTRGSFDMGRFAIRRIMKIWPMYYLYITVVAVWLFIEYNHTDFVHYFNTTILPAVFNYQNLSPTFYANIGHIKPQMGHTWSLAVEEHFYLLLPLVCTAALRLFKSPERAMDFVAKFCVFCFIACAGLRVGLNWHREFGFFTHLWPTYLRIDSLCFGVLLAYIYHAQPALWERLKSYRVPIVIASVICLIPLIVLSHEKSRFMYTFGYTFIYMGYGGLLVVILQTPLGFGRLGALLGSKFGQLIGTIGRYSYGIYLWNLLLGVRLISFANEHHWLPFRSNATLYWILVTILCGISSILIGGIMTRLVEIPTLLLRDRLFPARAEAVKIATPAADGGTVDKAEL